MTNKLLDEELILEIQQVFDAQLVHPIEILYFSKTDQCDSCEVTNQLLMEISSLSDKLHLSVYKLEENPVLARQYQVTLAPGLVIAGRDEDNILDFGIRLSGLPSGYEFSSLIQAIIMVSKRESGLKPEIRKQVSRVSTPINLKVFVTPTWPYCPQAVVLAHQLALENPFIQAEMIEANEFYDLAKRYNVSSVPQTTINDGQAVILGAVSDEYLLQEIIRSE